MAFKFSEHKILFTGEKKPNKVRLFGKLREEIDLKNPAVLGKLKATHIAINKYTDSGFVEYFGSEEDMKMVAILSSCNDFRVRVASFDVLREYAMEKRDRMDYAVPYFVFGLGNGPEAFVKHVVDALYMIATRTGTEIGPILKHVVRTMERTDDSSILSSCLYSVMNFFNEKIAGYQVAYADAIGKGAQVRKKVHEHFRPTPETARSAIAAISIYLKKPMIVASAELNDIYFERLIIDISKVTANIRKSSLA